MAYVKFDDLKAMLNLEKDDISEYPQLSIIQGGVESRIESYCKRVFEKDTVTEDFFIDRDALLHLERIPVETVSIIKVSRAGITLFEDFAWYYLDRKAGVKLQGTYENCDFSVTYTGGFEDLPPDIYRAMLLQICYEYQRYPNLGATSSRPDVGGSSSYPEYDLLSEVKSLLAKYVHPWGML